MSTDTANPFTDPFASLDTDEAERASKGGVPEWSGPIPASAQGWVDRALKTGKRQIVQCDNVELRSRLHSAVKAALALRNENLAIHTRDNTDEDGNLVEFTFTVGAPRGRKSTESE